MKKILRLIFILLLGISFQHKVDASIYYSDYSEYSKYQEEAIESSDLVDVDVEYRYRWYKITDIIGEYKLYNLSDKFNDDCYLTNYSTWQDNKINNAGYIYESRTKYEYTKAKKVRYIHLYGLQGSYDAFRITELLINVDNQEINYSYTCDGCYPNFEDYINNGISAENKSYIENGGSLIIDLGKEYPINQVDVIFYLFDLGPSEKLFTLGYSTDKKDIFVSQDYNLDFADNSWSNAVKIEKNITDLNVDVSDWTIVETAYTRDDGADVINEEKIIEYRYQEKWCRTVQSEKEYYSNYSNIEVDGYPYRDDSSKKKFYRYRTRDRLELNIYDITTSNFDLNNFIVDSTADVEIENNIDFNKNGNYEVKFILNDLIVTENVTLNITQNTIEELETEISDLNKQITDLEEELIKQQEEYGQQIKELNDKLGTCQSENNCLLDVVKQKETIIKQLEEELIILTDEINELKSELIDKNDQIIILTNQMSDLETQLNNQIKYLEEELSIKNNQIIILTNQISELEQKIIDKNSQLNKLINQLNESESELIIKNNQISELTNQISELKQQLIDKNNELTVAINEINQLKLELSNKNNKISEFNSKIKNLEVTLINKNDKLNELIDKINSLELELINKNNQLIESNENNASLNQEIQKYKIELSREYDKKITNLEKLNEFYKSKITELREDIKQLNENIGLNLSEKQQIIDQYQEEIEYLKNSCVESERIKQDNEKIKQENENLNNELNGFVLQIRSNRVFDFSVIIILTLVLIYIIFKKQKVKK